MRHHARLAALVLLPVSLSLGTFSPGARAQPAEPLSLHQIMADPDWIGPAVEQAWWSWDGSRAYYTLKRRDSTVRDTWTRPIDGGTAVRIDGAARADIDAANPVLDAGGMRMAFVRNGDVFVRDLRGGGLQQITRTEAVETQLQWSREGTLSWRSGQEWYRWSTRDGIGQAAVIKAEDDPAKPPKADELRDRQLRYFDTLRRERERREAAREQNEAWRRADPTRPPAPVYLGKDVEVAGSALSPDGRWLLVATTPKGGEKGQPGKMARFVTESGYEEVEDVRTLVGRNNPLPHSLWLVSMADGKPVQVTFDGLPGIGQDPVADLRRAAGLDALKGNRAVVLEESDAIRWRDDGRVAAIMLHAADNKDRWLVTLDPGEASLRTRHRLTDPAWINWDFNEFGWLPSGAGDEPRLWFLSEQSGWSHLHVSDGGKARALTSGRWEVSAPALSPDGSRFFFVCNRNRPGDYEVCSVDAAGGKVDELTALDGVESFVVSPDGRRLLVRHSGSYLPPQLAVVAADGSAPAVLTDTRTPEFKAMEWLQPQYVQVPSRHGAGTIWGKFYGPQRLEPGRQYPVVMFVHGAGYLQNVSDRYPNYFREQMFHNLLVQQGYLVLDLDFRASEGYGRDWRTAIYRRMGHPELEDYLDGIEWLVANKQADRGRVGIYGGSYGGFMAFMALFREPGVFKAGAALRPVTDWSQYNHGYTSNILNTPELDPEAYRRSSPMEYAAGLQDHLLIAHGMVDDNVFYKDSVMLAQKLIELRKDKWELASYPLEAHSYQHPDSWYDQYRRIHELFQRALR
jgi:dipeptidyl aminopeptidase/acylaminoacyl peptidase